MDRRQFTKGLAALGASPLVPATALANAAAPAATSANFTPFMFAQSSNFARMFGVCSPKMLADEFSVPSGVADAITNRLIRRGTLSLPNAFGVSHFIEPVRTTFTSTAAAQSTRTQIVRPIDTAAKASEAVSDQARDLLDIEAESEDAAADDTTGNAAAPSNEAAKIESEATDTCDAPNSDKV